MSISASQVKELREMSGVGMMECKKALVETDGDLQKALDLLRANSSLKAEKKASRVAADGAVKIADNSAYTSLVEINSETDFAAKDSQFKDFAVEVANYLSNNKVDDVGDLIEEFDGKRQSLIQSIGENIQLRRLVTLEVPSNGCIGSYVHSDGRLAAMVSIDTDNKELAKDLAMHVSATNPSCLRSEDIDPELLERERAIFLAQANDSGKDASIMEKMVEGKVKRFLSEVTLLSQGFVKDPDKSIEDLLNDNNASIISFARFKVGEGIEIEVKDFASEVAEQLQQ
jgi:elongation factor Ts